MGSYADLDDGLDWEMELERPELDSENGGGQDASEIGPGLIPIRSEIRRLGEELETLSSSDQSSISNLASSGEIQPPKDGSTLPSSSTEASLDSYLDNHDINEETSPIPIKPGNANTQTDSSANLELLESSVATTLTGGSIIGSFLDDTISYQNSPERSRNADEPVQGVNHNTKQLSRQTELRIEGEKHAGRLSSSPSVKELIKLFNQTEVSTASRESEAFGIVKNERTRIKIEQNGTTVINTSNKLLNIVIVSEEEKLLTNIDSVVPAANTN